MALSVPRIATDGAVHRRLLADGVNASLRGELNTTGQVTFLSGTTSTDISDSRMGYGRLILLVPMSANAESLGWHLSSMSNGTCTISHSAPTGDALFGWCVIGGGGVVGI